MRIISGKKRGSKIYGLDGDNTKPTSDRTKESLFNILENKLGNFDNLNILDIYSGTGAISLEFLSRGAKSATLVDSSKEAVNIINRNIIKLGYTEKTKVYNIDVKTYLENTKNSHFDLIYIDPPYGKDIFDELIKIYDNNILKLGGIIIFETNEKIAKETEKRFESEKENRLKIIDKRKYGKAYLIFFKNER